MKPEGRLTGASPEQIEAAIERLPKGGHLKWCAERYELIQAAPYLVTTDHRIVRVDDLRALAEFVIACNDEFRVSSDLLSVVSRIQALIGEAE